VSLNEAVLEQIGDRRLKHAIALQIHKRSIRNELLDQVVRRDNESESQARRQHL
jgi:hypothetical protein